MDSHPATDANFALARKWLDTCVGYHEACRLEHDPQLPTRVLDVAVSGADDTVRLHIATDNGTGRYVALSYCWGGAKQAMLTSDNLKEMIGGVKINELSRTAQDAITVTRRLGLRFLWIDALCIIQDSVQDWEIESARMGIVYHGAHVTLQASGTSSSDQGFLNDRKPRLPPAALKYETRGGEISQVFVREKWLPKKRSIEPLDERAWTFQEALLSRRLLTYGSAQISAECKVCFSSEGGTQLKERETFLGLPKPAREAKRGQLIPERIPEDMAVKYQRYGTWADITEAFSARKLTFAKDKLPALSGLASFLSPTRPGDTYLAGLWRNDMPQNLLWSRNGQVTRAKDQRAPSWSWACLDGVIYPSWSFEDQACCEIISVSTTTARNNPYGEVQGGVLSVRGQIKEAYRVFDPNWSDQYLLYECRMPDTDEEMKLSRIGVCWADESDPNQELRVPISTWVLRVTRSEGLALILLPRGFVPALWDGSYDV